MLAPQSETSAEGIPLWWGLTRRLFAPRKATCVFSPTKVRRGAGGNVGKRVPSGHNRRRRLATRSSGKQQAERTAVRAAPIVCPEESPLLFCRNIYIPLVFSPTTARRFPKGNGGKRVSSGYNRRRRLATRSSGKQQAGRTAVRTAPIVCPEESPLHCIDKRQLCRKKFPFDGA